MCGWLGSERGWEEGVAPLVFGVSSMGVSGFVCKEFAESRCFLEGT